MGPSQQTPERPHPAGASRPEVPRSWRLSALFLPLPQQHTKLRGGEKISLALMCTSLECPSYTVIQKGHFSSSKFTPPLWSSLSYLTAKLDLPHRVRSHEEGKPRGTFVPSDTSGERVRRREQTVQFATRNARPVMECRHDIPAGNGLTDGFRSSRRVSVARVTTSIIPSTRCAAHGGW